MFDAAIRWLRKGLGLIDLYVFADETTAAASLEGVSR